MCAGFEMDLPVTSGGGGASMSIVLTLQLLFFTLSDKAFVSDSGNCVNVKLHMAGYFVSLQVG